MKKLEQWEIYDPIHYAYKGRHIKGRMLGNLMAVLIVAASLIVGYFTEEVIFDTLICALTFGNFLRNLGIFVMLSKMGEPDYYVYDTYASCDDTTKKERVGIYDEMIKRAHRITLSFGFFELYFPFLLAIIIPNTLCKIVVPIIFITGVTIIKVIYNPEKSGKGKSIFKINFTYTYIVGQQPRPWTSRLAELCRRDIYFPGFYIFEDVYSKLLIVIRAVFTSAPFYAAGLLLSCQKQFSVKVFDDVRILIPVLIVGILCNILGDYKVFKSYKWCKGRITFDFINRIVANYFGIQTWDDVYDQRIMERRERKRKQEENERLQEERELQLAYLWLEMESKRIEEWKEEERKREERRRQQEEEERFKAVKRKFDQGKTSEISQEDWEKIIKLEAEAFKMRIRDSSRVSRTSIRRKTD